MPPGRKSISTIIKPLSSINGQDSPIKSTYECGSLVWCKYNRHPYWPGIIWKKITKPNGSLYEVLFFGTFSIGLPIDCKWLEPYEGAAEFNKRLKELRASETPIKYKPSQYCMNITSAKLKSFREAIKQASQILRCSNFSKRLELADNMLKGVAFDIFQLKVDDDEENEDETNQEDNDEKKEEDDNGKNSNIAEDNTSILSKPSIQNDQQIVQTMIIEERKKRKLEEDEDLSNTKIRLMTTTNELKQPSMNPPSSILFRSSTDQPIEICSNFVCHSLSPAEETFILDAIARSDPSCTFFQAKQIAEEMYSYIICINNSNRPLPVSEIWFYIFFYLHFEKLFSTHPHWLGDLEKTKSNINYVHNQQQQIIRLMKTYVR